MTRPLNRCWWWLARRVLRQRYRVRVIGLEALRELSGPTLIMPNHPGYIDPPLVLSHLRMNRPIRPVVRSTMYRLPFLYPIMRFIHALEVPDMSEQSLAARDRTKAMIDAVVAGLEQGDSFLIYPAGRTQRTGLEAIGGSRAVAEILSRCPRTNRVLVRTRGLWGSMYTRARTGDAPEFGKRLLQGFGWLLANLFVFSPRRDVTMTLEVLPAGSGPPPHRETLNPFLEAWYNREGPEIPSFVPYHRWIGPRSVSFPDTTSAVALDANKTRRATVEAVNEILSECLGRPITPEETVPETTLDALGLDSLDRMDVTAKIEDRFGFRSDRVPNLVGELWALAEGGVTTKGEVQASPPELWDRPIAGSPTPDVLADNIVEAFVRRALQHPDDAAVADRMSGVLTYRRLLVGALLLARHFQKLPGEAVGVLLPASAAADLTFLGLSFAGKLPALLNWTLGPGHLKQAAERLGLRSVVTSRKLVDRLGIEPPAADFVFLEELREKTGRLAAFRELAATHLLPRRLLSRAARFDPDEPAAVLFTSGSESAPKAVPLTHRNLIANVRASTVALQCTREDRLLGFLPPFHSFGLMGTLIAPLLTGVRVVHYPDPTHAAGLARTIAAYRPTLLMTTPTFFSYLLSSATADDLRSLRVVGTGAEKCPEAVFDHAARLVPGSTILEGYGITECSPLVASNRVGCVKYGSVGKPAEGVEVCIVDPDTNEPLPPNRRGMLWVRGPGVFRGYLRQEGASPFVDRDGKQWYVTGDLARQDEEGFLFFCGRLKRFLKAAGEMISLPALEEPLSMQWPPTEDGPQVAVEGIETPGGRWIVLFTTPPVALRDANAVLAQAGLRGVMRLDEVRQLDAIPVLGTGKTDYKALRHLIETSTKMADDRS